MRTIAHISIAAIIMMAVISPTVFSQITTNEQPVSINLKEIKDPPVPIFVDPPDMEKIRAEDAVNDNVAGGIQRIAVAIKINANSDTDGQWEYLSDGSVLWRISFISSGADALVLTYDRFWLPEGGKLFVYGQDYCDAIGAVTHEFLQGDQDNPAPFITGIISGDAITVEYFAPSYVRAKPMISFANIYYGYRYIGKNRSRDFGDPGTCQVNNNNDIAISIAPNPANDYIKVSIYKKYYKVGNTLFENENRDLLPDLDKTYRLRVISTSGLVVYSSELHDNSVMISTSGFFNGTYIIEISDGNKYVYQQLIIKH